MKHVIVIFPRNDEKGKKTPMGNKHEQEKIPVLSKCISNEKI
jgi:hypothetical protein